MKKTISLVIFIALSLIFLSLLAKEKPQIKKIKGEKEAVALFSMCYSCNPEREKKCSVFKDFEIMQVDLNDDGFNEIIIQEKNCSGNDCEFLIFQKKEKCQKILKIKMGTALKYYVLPKKTNEYYDLQVEKWTPAPSYAGGIYTNTYIWNGKDYEMKVPK